MVLASHLIWHGYGHWFPNDPRGSGSEIIREPKFAPLGAIHRGRKKVQPRCELRAFWRDGERLLESELFWFDENSRELIVRAFADAIRSHGYTLWAFASLKNHAHAVIRRHRDAPKTIWQDLARAMRDSLIAESIVSSEHPVWSSRPYAVYLSSREDIRTRVEYVERNPAKEGLPAQRYDFVKPYTGWTNRARFAKEGKNDPGAPEAR